MQWDEHQNIVVAQQEMSDEWILGNTKPCPLCKRPVSLIAFLIGLSLRINRRSWRKTKGVITLLAGLPEDAVINCMLHVFITVDKFNENAVAGNAWLRGDQSYLEIILDITTIVGTTMDR